MKFETFTIISALAVFAVGIGVIHIQEGVESRARGEAFKECLTEASSIDYVDTCKRYADWVSQY